MIDYNIVSIMIPTVLLGGYAGILLTSFLPLSASPIILILVLAYAAYETWNKAFKLWNKETTDFSKPESENKKN
jgi:uncharacterized membrane protein YfcA